MPSESTQKFGGPWTKEKLNIFEKYLWAYVNALKNKPFSKVYIDAFAGTGTIYSKDGEEKLDGSARIALASSPKFERYYFIEQNHKKYLELKDMIKNEFPELENRVVCLCGDANEHLEHIINSIDWNSNRGLLFIDPFATQFNWGSLVKISKTYAIDVWYLFPFSAVNRMLSRDGEKVEPWRRTLNRVLGCTDWFETFYEKDQQISLFSEGMEEQYYKVVNTSLLKKYIIKRLETVFPAVYNNPRVFYNSQNSPLFLFCFAVSNKNKVAQDLSMKIANDILKKN